MRLFHNSSLVVCLFAAAFFTNGMFINVHAQSRQKHPQRKTAFDKETKVMIEFIKTDRKIANLMPSISKRPTTSEIERYLNSYVDLASQYYVDYFRRTDISGCSREFNLIFKDLHANILQNIKVSKSLADSILNNEGQKIQKYILKKQEIEAEQQFIRGQLHAYGQKQISPISKKKYKANMDAVIKFINDNRPTVRTEGNRFEQLKAFDKIGSNLWEFRNKLLSNNEIHLCPQEFIDHFKEYSNAVYELVEVIKNRPPLPTSEADFLAIGLVGMMDPNGKGRDIISSLEGFLARLKEPSDIMDSKLKEMTKIAKSY